MLLGWLKTNKMKTNKQFEARVYMNRNNKQLSLIPIKKNLSREVMELMSNKNVVGFKLTIVKVLKEMPTPKIKVDRSSPESLRAYYKKHSQMYRDNKKQKGGKK